MKTIIIIEVSENYTMMMITIMVIIFGTVSCLAIFIYYVWTVYKFHAHTQIIISWFRVLT